jgi:hypothetical protein
MRCGRCFHFKAKAQIDSTKKHFRFQQDIEIYAEMKCFRFQKPISKFLLLRLFPTICGLIFTVCFFQPKIAARISDSENKFVKQVENNLLPAVVFKGKPVADELRRILASDDNRK